MIDAFRKITIRYWLLVGLANLLLVALAGLLMRIGFITPLPTFNLKYLLHAHSHFAFSGWVSHMLMVCWIAALFNKKSQQALPWKYQLAVIANLIAAYGMLISFFLQGYGLYSICFATLTIVISYFFAVLCWRDMNRPSPYRQAYHWFRAALAFLVISAFGTFILAYLMATHHPDSRLQHAAIYFFLHFQYNGWFFFACMALLWHWLQQKGLNLPHGRLLFWVFVLACLPTYLLSVPSWNLPTWLRTTAIVAVLAQGIAWALWLYVLLRRLLSQSSPLLPTVPAYLLSGVAIAGSIKLLLQGLSAAPLWSHWVYSFRPIVIGYLHLVLLVVITLFVLAYAFMKQGLAINKASVYSTLILTVGIVANELLLLVQGVYGLIGVWVAHLPIALAVASGVIVIGVAGLFWSQPR